RASWKWTRCGCSPTAASATRCSSRRWWASPSTRCCTPSGCISISRRSPGTEALAAYVLRRLWQFVPTLLGVVLLVFFLFNFVGGDLAYQLGWFPVQGWGISFAENLLRYSVLAIIVGVAVSLAPDIRLYRSFFLDEINQDYVRTARAKGLSENRVMWVHVLRNAAIPIVTNILL